MPDPIAITSGTRYAGDGERVAVMFPGGDYSPARPLLHFARSMLVQRAWTVQLTESNEQPAQQRVPGIPGTVGPGGNVPGLPNSPGAAPPGASGLPPAATPGNKP